MDYREVFEWKTVHSGHGRTPNIRSSTASWNYRNGLWIVCGAGSGQGKSSEVWKFDLEANKWLRIEARGESPPSRDGHSGTYVGMGKFVIFGGQGFAEKNNKLGKEGELLRTQTHCKRDVLNDLWMFDCEKLEWSPIYPDGLSIPMGRRGHSAIFVPPADGGAAGDALSYAGSMAFTTSSYTHNTSMAHLSQPSLHAGDMSSHHTGSRSARDASAAAPGGGGGGGGGGGNGTWERIPDNALLVFGGAGIELSKYSEQLYNELWSFSLTTNLWTRHHTRGVDPPALCDHRAERVGDHMLVVGGLAPHRLDGSGPGTGGTGPHDLLSLHLPSCTWSTVPLSDASGGRLGLGLHGFSLVADAHSGRLWVFGGGEVVDCRTAATTRSPVRRGGGCGGAEGAGEAFAVHVKDRVLQAVHTTGTAPSPRHAHASFAGQSVDVVSSESATPSASALDTRLALMRQADDLAAAAPRTLLLVFGGVSLDGGGYCDPALFALTSTLVATTATPTQGVRTAVVHGGRDRSREATGGGGGGGGGQAAAWPATGADDFALDGGLAGRGGSIWDALQARAGGAGGGGGASPGRPGFSSTSSGVASPGAAAGRREPATWAEIKLSLSASRSQRLFDVLPADGRGGGAGGGGGGGGGDAAVSSRIAGGGRRSSRRPETQSVVVPPRSPQRLLNLPEFGVRSAHSTSRGSPLSPWHLPGLGLGLSLGSALGPGAGLEQATLSAPSAFSMGGGGGGGGGRLGSQTLTAPSSSQARGLRSQSATSPRQSASSHVLLAHSRSAHTTAPAGVGVGAGTGAGRHGAPGEELEAALRDRRRERIAEIKRSLRPLLRGGQSKCATRERFKELFPCDYSHL